MEDSLNCYAKNKIESVHRGVLSTKKLGLCHNGTASIRWQMANGCMLSPTKLKQEIPSCKGRKSHIN